MQDTIMEDFLKRLVERTNNMKIGDPFAEDTTVGATISQEQGAKVLSYIEMAKSEVWVLSSQLCFLFTVLADRAVE